MDTRATTLWQGRISHTVFEAGVIYIVRQKFSLHFLKSTGQKSYQKKPSPAIYWRAPQALRESPQIRLLKILEDMEKEHIGKILAYTEGNGTKAAHILGISRGGLIAKIKKYKLV